MAYRTVDGFIRQTGDAKNAGSTPSPVVCMIKCTVDPTAATAGIGKYLPANSIPLSIIGMGGGTGGSSPTIDVGVSGTTAGLANELAADAVVARVETGSLIGIKLAAQTEIWAGVGASAATGGTTTFLVEYVMFDAGGW